MPDLREVEHFSETMCFDGESLLLGVQVYLGLLCLELLPPGSMIIVQNAHKSSEKSVGQSSLTDT